MQEEIIADEQSLITAIWFFGRALLPPFDDRPLARVGEDGVVRLLGVRGCGLEGLPKHESGIFRTPGLALAAHGKGQHGVGELGQKVSAVLDR